MNRIRKAVLATFVWTTLFAAGRVRDTESLVVHEWGTFTSVASDDGSPVRWAPLNGRADLPCFVNRLLPYNAKWSISALVRMETPVIYFYTPRALQASVRVDFPRGLVTEWYPPATRFNPPPSGGNGYTGGHIDWTVQVEPNAKPDLPTSKSPSHYYAARETGAAPVRSKEKWEKLLFYRGVGHFDVEIRPTYVHSGKLKIQNRTGHPLRVAMLFENQRGALTVRTATSLGAETVLDAPVATKVENVHSTLVEALTGAGLYRPEALAMVETWKDSWFEEGARLFYIVPKPFVDGVLPLKLDPAPAQVARVFVGRIELASEGVRKTLETAIRNQDEKTLVQFGRFLRPLIQQAGKRSSRELWTPFVSRIALDMERDVFQGAYCVD